MSFWSKKRKFDDKTENLWIKYFKGNEGAIILPEEAGSELVRMVGAIPNASISKQRIYSFEDPSVDNRRHLLNLFRYNEPISSERRDLVNFVHENMKIVNRRSKVWVAISKVVMQTLFQFFFQYSSAVQVKKSPCEAIDGFSPEMAKFVAVAVEISKDVSDDLVGVLTLFFQNLVSVEDEFPSEPALREFVLGIAVSVLDYLQVVRSWPDLRTHVFVFTMRYFKTIVNEMPKILLNDAELEYLLKAMEIVESIMLKLKPTRYVTVIEMVVAGVMSIFKNLLYTTPLGYNSDKLYEIGMQGIKMLLSLYDPARPKKGSLGERSEICYVVLFGVWCIDAFGFASVPNSRFRFITETIEQKENDKFVFRETDEHLDKDLMMSLRWEKYPIDMLHKKCLDALEQIVLVFRIAGSIDVCLNIAAKQFTEESVLKDVVFSVQELVPFDVVFMFCYFVEKFDCIKEMTHWLNLCFQGYYFDHIEKVSGSLYAKRMFFRNYLFGIFYQAFKYTPNEIVSKLTDMLNSPISVALEIVLFFNELLASYQDDFIQCLSLTTILYLDQTLQEQNLPGREVVFAFLSNLTRYQTGISVFLGQDFYVQRLFECTFDQAVMTTAFSLLRRSMERMTEVDYFVRMMDPIERALSQAVDEGGCSWTKYLVAFFPFFNEIVRYFRLLYGSKDVKFSKLIATFIRLTHYLGRHDIVDVLVLALSALRTLIKGDSGYREECVALYELELFPTQTHQAVIDEMLALVYEIPSNLTQRHHCMKNPEALNLLHHSLLAYPDVHKNVFSDVFRWVNVSLQNQLVLVRSSFAHEIIRFLHTHQEHVSYETFADGLANVFVNFFDLQFFTDILDLGMTWNWESLITKVSEFPVSEDSGKPFVFLQGGDTQFTVKSPKGVIERIIIDFSIPCIPLSDSVLLSVADKDGSVVNVSVKTDGTISLVANPQGNEGGKEIATLLDIEPNQPNSWKLNITSTTVVLELGEGATVDMKHEFSSGFAPQEIAVGRSLSDRNSSMAVTVYQLTLKNHKHELFATDCSTIDNGQIVSLAENMESVESHLNGLFYPRRISMAEPLIANGVVFDLIDRADSTHSAVFVVRVVKNLIKNDPTFEPRLFDFHNETCFWYYFHIMDKKLMSEELVAELDELSSILQEENNRFIMYDTCWFSFDVWSGSSVFCHVCMEILPEIMTQNQKFLDENVTVTRFLQSGCDGKAFWHVVCHYLALSEREEDFPDLMAFISERKPVYFFLNLFGLCNFGKHTTRLMRKVPQQDLSYYYKILFNLLKQGDEESVVCDEIFETFLLEFMEPDSLPILFDVLMLVCQYLPARAMNKLVHVIAEVNEELLQKMMVSELVNLWMTCMIVQQSNEIIDLRNCAPDLVGLFARVLLKSQLLFRGVSTCLVMVACQANIEICHVFRSIFIKACEYVLTSNVTLETDVLSIIIEHMFFVGLNEKYGKNIALWNEMNEELGSPREPTFKPITLDSVVELLQQGKEQIPCFLSNRLRISEEGKWLDAELATKVLGILHKNGLSRDIKITDNQFVRLCHIHAHIIQVLLETNSETLKDAEVQISQEYGDDWESMDDLAVRIVVHGAFKRMQKGLESPSDVAAFVARFRQHIEDDSKLNQVPCDTFDDIKFIIGSSFTESYFMWMRLLDNFCVVTYSKRNGFNKRFYHRFPFVEATPTISGIEIDVTEFLVRKWSSICVVKNVLMSRSQTTWPDIPLLSREFEPVSQRRSKFVYLNVDTCPKLFDEDKMLCPVLLHNFEDTIDTFFYCNCNCFVVGGLKVLHSDIKWFVTNSPVEVDIYTTRGESLHIVFEDEESRDFVYNFIDHCECIVEPGLTNMICAIRLNIMHGKSYHSGHKMLFPTLAMSSLSQTETIGPGWHFIWRMINSMDLRTWFSEKFGKHSFEPHVLSIDHSAGSVESSSTTIPETCCLYASAKHVVALVADSDSDSLVNVMRCVPDFKSLSRTRLRMPLSSSMKCCFFNETAFFIYIPKHQIAKVFKRQSDGDEFKVISSFTVRNYVKSLMHVDSQRLVVHFSDDVVCVVTLKDHQVTTRRVFAGNKRILGAAVNGDLNVLATIDDTGCVTLTSLASFAFITSLNLKVSNVNNIQILSYGVLVIEHGNIIEAFGLDGACLSRTTNKGYQICGVVGAMDQILAVKSGEKRLLFLDPFNLSPIKQVPLDNPIKTFASDVLDSAAFVYDGKKLIRIKLT